MTPRRPAAPADCADEPIHLAGAIQPHGWLLSCDPADWTIRHASANVDGLFECDAAAMLGTPLSRHVDATVLEALEDALRRLESGLASQRVLAANLGPLGRICEVSLHLQQGLAHVEIEPQAGSARGATPELSAQAMIARVADVDEPGEFFARVARQVRDLTGYDRVMVYRFRDDDAGEVIAEARADDIEPYLGLRFPASDIPAQARRLYVHNRLRVIPDVAYEPVPILPRRGAPLDLSQHVLRSVSPVHVEYLRNMGVGASMSISIITGGRLWGLVACHHRVARPVPTMTRAVADLFGMYVSMRVAARRQHESLARVERTEAMVGRLHERFAEGSTLADAFGDELPIAAALLRADAALLTIGHARRVFGHVPDDLAAVLQARAAAASGVAAVSTRGDADPATAAAPEYAGVLTIAFGERGDGVHFLRREQVQDVRWAGEPRKAMVPTDDGTRLAPRRSFREWRETVGGQAVAWNDDDRRIGERLFALFATAPRPDPATSVVRGGGRGAAIGDQRRRLAQLGALLDSVERIDPQQSRLLARRIASLEVQLRDLVGDADPSTA